MRQMLVFAAFPHNFGGSLPARLICDFKRDCLSVGLALIRKYVHTYTHRHLHTHTLHHITSPYIISHLITIHFIQHQIENRCITWHDMNVMTWHHITTQDTAMHGITLHSITLHWILLRCLTHYTLHMRSRHITVHISHMTYHVESRHVTSNYSTWYHITLHDNATHYMTTLHCIALHYVMSRYITEHLTPCKVDHITSHITSHYMLHNTHYM